MKALHNLVATALLALAAALLPTTPTAAQPVAGDDAESLQVSEPYLELRTGPGRGYPVFFVVEKAQWVRVEQRRTDWYRVRAQGGQTGWVQRTQLEKTLTAAGSGKTFRDLLLDDSLARRVEFGGGVGRFKGEPLLRLGLGVRMADTLAVELGAGQVQGRFSGTDFWHLGLVSEPWSDRRFSPTLTVGLGQFRNIPNTSLVDATPTHARLALFGLGLRWHLSERFTARVDWTLYTAFVSDARSTEYRAFSAGLGFFF